MARQLACTVDDVLWMQNCGAHTSSCLLLTVLSLCALHKQPLLFGVAVHSYAVHKYLLKDSEWCFQAWHINLIWVLRLVILRGTCHFLHSHVYDPWNEQNGSENERITIKLHPKSADRLMSICGANFKPSKIQIISVLRCLSLSTSCYLSFYHEL